MGNPFGIVVGGKQAVHSYEWTVFTIITLH